jgi:hypothetical protein
MQGSDGIGLHRMYVLTILFLVPCSARDRPEKARGIEIYSCYDFERMRLHWNGCGLLLHELCHLIHQFCLGLDHPVVQQLYEQGRQSGNYNKTLRRDWAGLEEDYDMGKLYRRKGAI